MSNKDRVNTAWPVNSHFDLLDAYMRNPIEVKRVNVATNSLHVVGEDRNGIRHYAHTDRIASAARFEKTKTPEKFDDLFGSDEPSGVFEDLF